MDLFGSTRGTGVVLLLPLIFFLLYRPGVVFAAGNISVFSPGKAHFAGEPLVFHFQTRDIINPVQARVYYRYKGINTFHFLVMKKETAVDFRVLLKARKIIPPGMEYYFVVRDQAGHTFLFPIRIHRNFPIL